MRLFFFRRSADCRRACVWLGGIFMGAKFALLFDLDGTLVDTDQHHIGAYNELLSSYGRSITVEDYKRDVMGFTNDDIMRRLFPDQSSARHVELADRKEA